MQPPTITALWNTEESFVRNAMMSSTRILSTMSFSEHISMHASSFSLWSSSLSFLFRVPLLSKPASGSRERAPNAFRISFLSVSELKRHHLDIFIISHFRGPLIRGPGNFPVSRWASPPLLGSGTPHTHVTHPLAHQRFEPIASNRFLWAPIFFIKQRLHQGQATCCLLPLLPATCCLYLGNIITVHFCHGRFYIPLYPATDG